MTQNLGIVVSHRRTHLKVTKVCGFTLQSLIVEIRCKLCMVEFFFPLSILLIVMLQQYDLHPHK